MWSARTAFALGIVLVAVACRQTAPAKEGDTSDDQTGDRTGAYADIVIDYAPVILGEEPTEPHRGGDNALEAPDYAGVNSCSSMGTCTFVSLGDGGSITLGFLDHLIVASGDAAPDLRIYEVGPDIEDTFVEISGDNATWLSVGAVFGSTATIDIDAYGPESGSTFVYVRLTDDSSQGRQSKGTVGADIDAVEALSFVATQDG
ncbi:MAG: hypothetical protein Q8P41_17400 [Pseudomonadota bacterium]|nr:hypothetical protein [Pseudomonadota bacterium]